MTMGSCRILMQLLTMGSCRILLAGSSLVQLLTLGSCRIRPPPQGQLPPHPFVFVLASIFATLSVHTFNGTCIYICFRRYKYRYVQITISVHTYICIFLWICICIYISIFFLNSYLYLYLQNIPEQIKNCSKGTVLTGVDLIGIQLIQN